MKIKAQSLRHGLEQANYFLLLLPMVFLSIRLLQQPLYTGLLKTCYSKRREKIYKANMFFVFVDFVYWIAIFAQNTK